MTESVNRYSQIVERIFKLKFVEGMSEVDFRREDVEEAANELKIPIPKNLGDVLYSFRFRTQLPATVQSTATEGNSWVIELAGRGKYRFKLKKNSQIEILPNQLMSETKIPDATPGLVSMYALNDEQALLAKLRYNRLLDIFTGIACYSLQNHLRTSVPELGQVETDELYIGVDRRGIHFVLPVQAKGGRDRLNIVQIEQDMALCSNKYPSLICRPIAAQFMSDNLIALFEFEKGNDGVSLLSERHYRLVRPEELTVEELMQYRMRSAEPG